MERDLAVHVAITGLRASAEIGNLIPLLKQHCDDAEYDEFRIAIAAASYQVGNEIMERIFRKHPDIKEEFESRLKKFGFAV